MTLGSRKRRRTVLIALATAGVFALTACNGGSGSGGAGATSSGVIVQDSTVTVGEQDEPPSWNIYAQSGTGSGNSQWGNIFDALLDWNYDKKEYDPYLATSWESSADLKTWTFHLRQGVKFSDGTPFTVDDVLFSFDRMKNHPDSLMASHFAHVTKMEAPDQSTVVLHLDTPIASFLSDIEGRMIVSKHAYDTMGEDKANHAMIGTGPFKLESWVEGQQMTLVRNDNFWGDKPSVQKLVLKVIPDDAARLAALKSGEVQIIRELPSQDIPTVKNTPGVKVVTNPGVRILFMPFNPTIKPYDDPRVREAISKAIDVHTIVDGVFDGTVTEMKGPMPDFIPGADPSWKGHVYDPEAAKALVQEIGGGQPVKITFTSATGNYPGDTQVNQVVVEQLKAVGFDVQFDSPDFAVLSANQSKGKVGFYLITKGGYQDAGAVYTQYWLAGQSKRTMWDDPALNDVLTKQAAEPDTTKREALLKDAGNMLVDQDAAIWFGTYENLWATADNIKWQPNAGEWINGTDIDVLQK
ncbi:peptide/nickel transport system substrate-binding protein [Asanoa ferruginea]|uniref:Peptide/nickel transport system substrate-binding protein n=1 Tax=Asanoa ferruginea TaxID=53367 RepID=A0A3D9ZRK2_9ACTN|nr:peptide/nickel transport system substrate-binding protein [Asanoa ferruginea]